MDSNPVSFATKASDSGEKLSAGVTQTQLIISNSIRLSKQILMSQRVLHIQDTARPTDKIRIIMLWSSMTQLLPSIQSIRMCFAHHQSVAVTSFFHDIEVHTMCWRRATRSTSSRIWLMVNEHRRTYITYDPSLSRTSKSSLWNQPTDIVAMR